jgi:hypothetical protein
MPMNLGYRAVPAMMIADSLIASCHVTDKFISIFLRPLATPVRSERAIVLKYLMEKIQYRFRGHT